MAHKRYFSATVTLFLALAVPAAAQPGPPRPGIDYIPGELLVRFKPAAPGLSKVLPVSPKGRLKRRFPNLNMEQWQLPSGVDPLDEAARLKASGQVALAEPNYRRYPALIPSDALYVNNQSWIGRLGLREAWDQTQGDGIIVAVIDDAFDTQHQDLVYTQGDAQGKAFGNGWGPSDATATTTLDPDAAACGENPGAHEHGTEVAGMVRAVARHAQIMPLKVGCDLDVAEELHAIEYAIIHGADVINISYGSPYYSQIEFGAIQQLLAETDVVLVASAGNYHGDNDNAPLYPASLNVDNVIAVAASDTNTSTGTDALTHWSHWGATQVDLAAPGVNIFTTAINNNYQTSSGTSLSAPIVAGVAALLKSHVPTATINDLKGALLASVEPLSNSSGRLATDGRVNALNALNAISAAAAPPVLVIDRLTVIDTAGGDGDGWLEAGETATLRVTVKNVWAAADAVQATLSSTGSAAVVQDSASSGTIAQGGIATFDFGVELTQPTAGYQRLPFKLTLTSAATSQTRQFSLETGTLNNAETVTTTIQRDEFDEFHTYQIYVPPGAPYLVFELEYDPSTDPNRKIGMAVSYDQRPRVNYVGGTTGYELVNGSPSHIVQDGNAKVRLSWRSTLTAGRYYVTVFNAINDQTNGSFVTGVPYHLRACHSNAVGNLAPVVTLYHNTELLNDGMELVVGANEVVTLSGTISDPEGDAIVSKGWSQQTDDKTQPVVLDDSGPGIVSFTAPSSGSLTIRYSASDSRCAVGEASVKVTVRNDPPKISTGRNFFTTQLGYPLNFPVQVEGSYGSFEIETLADGAMLSAPPGSNAGTYFLWTNPGPLGDHRVVFVAVDDADPSIVARHEVTIRVVPRSVPQDPRKNRRSTGGSGGVDPTFMMLLLASWLVLRRRRA